MATETLALFEHLEFDFLEEFDVFAARRGRTRDHHPPALFRAFLHCYYKNVYGIRPVTRELQNTVVWLSCGFDRPPSRRGRSLPHRPRTRRRRGSTFAEQALSVGPRPARLDLLHRFHRREDDARRPRRVERLRSNRRRVLPRLRLYDRLDRAKIPIAAEFTESKQALEEMAMRVTCDALAVEKPIWMLETAPTNAGWHDHAGRRGRASRSVQRTKHRRSERHRVQGRSPHRRTQRGRSAEAIDARRDVQPPEWSRTNQRRRQGLRPRARSRPTEAASTHEHKIPRAVPSSRYCDRWTNEIDEGESG